MRGARSVRPRWSEQEFVDINPRYYRPTEIDVLLGDSSKATRLLGGRPSTSFAELVKLMMDADLELADRELRVGAGPGRHQIAAAAADATASRPRRRRAGT